MNNYELIKFKNGEIEIDVSFSPNEDTVWLTKEQLAVLYDRDRSVISRHINDIYNEGESQKDSTCANFAQVRIEGKREVKREVEYYNLDIIISVGYRVKSKNGILFRKWANSILKDYLIRGFALNEKRLIALNKTIDIQNKIIANAYQIDSLDVKYVVDKYIDALTILDDYDHHRLDKDKKFEDYNELTIEDIKEIIKTLEIDMKSDVFGVEKEKGKVEGILAAVYQNVFGQEVYPSIKNKAVHLLYFLIKDHPFADGCKRIAAASFLQFLAINGLLTSKLTSQLLVAITLLTAESSPEDMESILLVISNII